MNIAIIGTVGIPAKYGGFETLVHHLVKNLKENHQFTVYCSTKAYPDKPSSFESAKLEYIPLNANGAQSVPYDILSLTHALKTRNDVLLVLGVSGALFLPFIRLFTSRKIILHIDGLEWKRAKWNKMARMFLKFSEKIGVWSSHKIIADNLYLETYVKETYGKDSALIEYGADHIMAVKREIDPHPYAFSVCRIEPENNVHMILEAFSQTDQTIKFVGNWNNSEYGKGLRARYINSPNIELLDPIYDQEKLDKIRGNCYLYLHGHSAGGTNPSLVEAMYLGLPILAYNATYNRATTEERAIYFNTAEDLTQKLSALSPMLLRNMAAEMTQIAQRRYTWQIISQKYNKLFHDATDDLPRND